MNTTDLNLELPGRPDVTVTHQVLEHGRVRYRVRGRRLRGTLVVAPYIPHDGQIGQHLVHVNLGEGIDSVRPYTPRPDEPVVNGVRVHGASEALDPDRLPAVVLASRVSVLLSDYGTRRVPDGAREALEAVIKAVMRHWRRRADRADLVQAAERRDAASLVVHEQRRVEDLTAKLAETRAERAAAGNRSRQISGLDRRRQPPARPALAVPEHVPMVASDGTPMGTLSVRELEVDAHHGRVVYTVSGPRTRGLFTVSPDPYDNGVIPQGLSISYGRPLADDSNSRLREEMPQINGVIVHGAWRYGGRTPITPTSPPQLPARVATGDGRYAAAPAATTARASAVLRALVLHHLARPDRDALRIAAGKQRVAGRRRSVRDELAKLRRTETRQLRALERHKARRDHFAALVAEGRVITGSSSTAFQDCA
ncbi:hypothetical protein [Streptomyces sp. NBC_01601]|uniref:hypothetical protein n=1 Tax=Streptomyces sp. NBC_01601 TaxID=2975892 RepID=UPI002E2E2F99|nr:hypothetical protein [Streptomyces sp. NBC_01601]